MNSTTQTTTQSGKNPFAVVVTLLSLLVLMLLLGLYLGRCLQQSPAKISNVTVLGVSNFSTSVSPNPAVDGSGVVFTANAAADSSGIANATIKFDLSGQGAIDNNIHGPGVCLKVTDATAVCNNVNIEANQTASWTIPVTVNSNCSKSSPASLSFQAQMIAPVGTFTSTAGVNCIASSNQGSTPIPTSSSGGNPTPTPTPSSSTTTSTGGGSTNNSGGTGTSGATGATTGSGTTGTGGGTGTTGTGAGGKNVNVTGISGQGVTPAVNNASAGQDYFAGLLCYRFGGTGGLPLIPLLFILWLVAAITYFLYSKRERHTTEVITEKTESSKE